MDDEDTGFYEKLEKLGEHAVRRRLESRAFPVGELPMAANWLDLKAAERETRLAQQQTTRDWWARGLAIVALVVAIAMPLLNAWLFRGQVMFPAR